MAVRLHRRGPGFYTAYVRDKDVPGEPFELMVLGPDPHFPQSPGYQWVVESDDEECFFGTLRDARSYVNRFFDPA